MQLEELPRSEAQPRVFLQPIAAPSILWLYGVAGATLMAAAQMAHWFGSSHTTLLLVPFAAIFGGLAQFLSAMADNALLFAALASASAVRATFPRAQVLVYRSGSHYVGLRRGCGGGE